MFCFFVGFCSLPSFSVRRHDPERGLFQFLFIPTLILIRLVSTISATSNFFFSRLYVPHNGSDTTYHLPCVHCEFMRQLRTLNRAAFSRKTGALNPMSEKSNFGIQVDRPDDIDKGGLHLRAFATASAAGRQRIGETAAWLGGTYFAPTSDAVDATSLPGQYPIDAVIHEPQSSILKITI
jgi:hypothetical protein